MSHKARLLGWSSPMFQMQGWSSPMFQMQARKKEVNQRVIPNHLISSYLSSYLAAATATTTSQLRYCIPQ
eukprot:scaffold63901_cov52-Phaeocystis_antarctica.AAC.2